MPVINEQFPIRDGGSLSPPIVAPVGACAKAVHVSGFIAHALVRVFVNGAASPVATVRPYFADADVTLPSPLNVGDRVTATQEVMGFVSGPSVTPAVVSPYSPPLNKPVVGPNLFSCGRIVPADQLNPGTHVSVFRNGGTAPIGEADATQVWQPVVTQSLATADQVTAVQIACPDDSARRIVSPTSDPVPVAASPAPPPAPTVAAYPLGADAVVASGLFVGAEVKVLDRGATAGSGFATAPTNRAPLQPPATSASRVSATQTLCATSPPSVEHPPSSSLGAPSIVPPVCAGTHDVTVRDTYPNAVVVLFRNGSPAGMAGGVVGDLTMSLGGGATWALGDEIRVLQYVTSVVSPSSSPVFADCAVENVLTQHNDNARSGSYPVERHLTPGNVNRRTFGRLYSRNVDGGTVGQPLYMRAVRTTRAGLKNLFFVTTEKNNIYAFDADDADPDPTHGLIWQRNLCPSLHTGVCGETWSGLVGITATPVIDASTANMYVVARCSDDTHGPNDGANFVYAVNLADGNDRVPRVQVTATDPAHQGVTFDAHCERNRPGLLLSRGVVYAGFGTFSCDAGCANAPYHGWVIGFRQSDLARVAVFDTSPTQGLAGIWQTGNGLVGGDDGSIYFETGNGPVAEPLQDSFVKLRLAPGPAGLALAAKFTPNDAVTLSNGDTDLGSGGPMLLPGGRLVGGGKQGRYYVLDAATMSLAQDTTPDRFGYDGFQAFTNTYHDDGGQPACPAAGGAAGCDTSAAGGRCFIDPVRYANGELCGPNIHGGPVFWRTGPSSGFIYEMPEKDFLKGFRYDVSGGHVTEAPAVVATGSLAKPPTDGMPGGYSSVSANGTADGIVWTSLPFADGQWNPVPGRLAAFNATTLAQLWSDDDNVLFAKAVPPTIADGKVVRATAANQVIVYGLTGMRGMKAAGAAHAGAEPVVPATTVEAAEGSPPACLSIAQKHANYGGDTGLLGAPTGDETPVEGAGGGRFRTYRGSVLGMIETVASQKRRMPSAMPTCSMPAGKASTLLSAIYWSPKTCAHVVQGEILALWQRKGGPRGALGYPIDDETLTPDHLGRMSAFEHGQIWWYPKQGAAIHARGQSDGGAKKHAPPKPAPTKP